MSNEIAQNARQPVAAISTSVAVDIGGTFTDILAYDADTDRLIAHKVDTTPQDVAVGMLRGVAAVVDLAEVRRLVHGTTVGLNTVLTRAGSRTLVVTTHPFRDLLHLGRAERTEIWRLDYQRPVPLVSLDEVETVRERIAPDGTVLAPLEDDELVAIAERIKTEAIASVAICFLHSCRNPQHELRARTVLTEHCPGLNVSVSHEVASEIREYERFATTVVNAYIAEPIRRYLARVQSGITDQGYRDPLFVMRSSGGVTSAEIAERSPIQTLLSGPAGGVIGAQRLSTELERSNLIAIDMGGTSLDASLIIGTKPSRASHMVLNDSPILMPVVDLVTIGAGGGSIASTEAGALRVGPESAGALPGPVCYGRGGTRPTVTDANLVLGLIDPEFFLGGAMKLDLDAAHAAITDVASELGVAPMAAAEGIVAVTNARMADALRSLTIKRGHDPREFALLVFGGAGPLHGAALAEELEISEVIVPSGTGLFSAWGMLHAPVRHDVSAPLHTPATQATQSTLATEFRKLQDRLQLLLERDGVPHADARYEASADMRYVGQEFFLSVDGTFTDEPTRWESAFHETYRRLHGHSRPDIPAEFVNLRVAGQGPELPRARSAKIASTHERPHERQIFLDGDFVTAEVIQRDNFGTSVSGPAIIEESASTTFVPPAWKAELSSTDAIRLTRAES